MSIGVSYYEFFLKHNYKRNNHNSLVKSVNITFHGICSGITIECLIDGLGQAINTRFVRLKNKLNKEYATLCHVRHDDLGRVANYLLQQYRYVPNTIFLSKVYWLRIVHLNLTFISSSIANKTWLASKQLK